MKKFLSLALAALMLFLILPMGLTSCDEQTAGAMTEMALQLIEETAENYENAQEDLAAAEEAADELWVEVEKSEAAVEDAQESLEEDKTAEEAGPEAALPTEAEAQTAAEEAARIDAEEAEAAAKAVAEDANKLTVEKDGTYDDKEHVALYIHTYGKLPSNYITKKDAEKLGWSGGSVEKYAEGKCIGGMKFGNYEGILPTKNGRTYTECDIGTLGRSSRGAKRIVFSNDGLIYYTEDHYETFELLYGEE